MSNAEAAFEFEVDWLGEPRPTSVDVFLHSSAYRVAVECKFTERDFGQCSRPTLTPDDRTFEPQYCDGNYAHQMGRASRCALTNIGVTYWDHAPRLFDWDAGVDHAPCPMRATYQLARNAITACSRPDQTSDASRGHVLVVYDQRNPEFAPGGVAHGQFATVSKAALSEGLLRQVPWQTLAGAVATDADFAWLVDGLRERHGICAD